MAKEKSRKATHLYLELLFTYTIIFSLRENNILAIANFVHII